MFSFLNLMIFSVCSRRLPFTFSRTSLFSPYFQCGFLQGTPYFTRVSNVSSHEVAPISPYFHCEFPSGSPNFPRSSTVGSPCVYLTISPRVRPSCVLSRFARDRLSFSHASSYGSRRVVITCFPRAQPTGYPTAIPVGLL